MTLPGPSDPLILTGAMRIGKSTFVRQVIDSMGTDVVPAGFFTRRIEKNQQITGHALCSWNGQCRRFSSRNDSGTAFPFRVNRDVFETFGVELLQQTSSVPWYVIDELGVMEKGCMAFETALKKSVKRGGPGIIVIQQRALSYWREILGLKEWSPLVLDDDVDRQELLGRAQRHLNVRR